MKKNSAVIFGLIAVLAAGSYWVYQNKKMLGLRNVKVTEVNILLLPRYRNVDHPSALTVNKNFDPTPLIKKLEAALNTEKVKYKIRFDGKYVLEKTDFSDLKNTIVFANTTFLFKMSKKNALLDPLMTFSPNAVNDCSEDGALVVLNDSPISSLQDAAEKSIMVEGLAGVSNFTLSRTAKEISAFTKEVFSEVSYSVKKEDLLAALVDKKVDMIFLGIHEVANEGAMSLYGKLNKEGGIEGQDNMKVLYRTTQAIPCGFVMSTADVLPYVKDEFGMKINSFVMDKNNKTFLDQTIGIKSFHPVGIDTWQKAYEFMVDNDIQSPMGKLILSKTKNSSEM